jgi:hypothetical protein
MDYPSEVTERAATSAQKCDGCDEPFPTRAYACVFEGPAGDDEIDGPSEGVAHYCPNCVLL